MCNPMQRFCRQYRGIDWIHLASVCHVISLQAPKCSGSLLKLGLYELDHLHGRALRFFLFRLHLHSSDREDLWYLLYLAVLYPCWYNGTCEICISWLRGVEQRQFEAFVYWVWVTLMAKVHNSANRMHVLKKQPSIWLCLRLCWLIEEGFQISFCITGYPRLLVQNHPYFFNKQSTNTYSIPMLTAVRAA